MVSNVVPMLSKTYCLYSLFEPKLRAPLPKYSGALQRYLSELILTAEWWFPSICIFSTTGKCLSNVAAHSRHQLVTKLHWAHPFATILFRNVETCISFLNKMFCISNTFFSLCSLLISIFWIYSKFSEPLHANLLSPYLNLSDDQLINQLLGQKYTYLCSRAPGDKKSHPGGQRLLLFLFLVLCVRWIDQLIFKHWE